jgi:hypothetical protein
MGPVAPENLEAINQSVCCVIKEAGNKEDFLRRKLATILAHKDATTP